MTNTQLKKKYGKVHKHSIYMHCWVCHTWGIGFPNDKVCGNCGSEETTTYYPDDIWDFIHSALEEARKDILNRWEEAIFYSEDTKSCLDRKVMENHFKEAVKEFISYKKETKK